MKKINDATFFADIKHPGKQKPKSAESYADSWIVRKYSGMGSKWKIINPKNRKKS